MKETGTASASQSGIFHLGKELAIYRLGFGAMRLTGPGVWGEPKNPKAAQEVLLRAIDLGVNFIDTSDAYGPEINEHQIATALYPYPKQLVIATKGGLTRPGPNQWVPNGRPSYLTQCVEMSLRRLKLERIDLYQLHAVDQDVPIEDSVGALKEMQEQGKIRHIGLSNVSVSEIERAKKIADIVSVQNQYNLAHRRSEDVLTFCEENKLAFIPWYPLASGNLANSSKHLQALAKKKGVTEMQLALAWLLHHSPVMVPIPGTSNLKHLEENIAAASLHLTKEEVHLLEV